MVKTSESLNIFSLYSRKKLEEEYNITDVTINTGIFHPKGHASIWLFVTKIKTSDRTNYNDDFDGQILNFEGQMAGRTDKKIINHSFEGNELLVFYRERKDKHPGYAFKYLGRFQYISHKGNKPKRFILQALDIEFDDSGVVIPKGKEVASEEFSEGKAKTRIQTYYERNAKLRAESLKIHGTVCAACGFDFSEMYGEQGEGYIEIHHLFPVSSFKEEKNVDPKNDLIPLCSNCHRMVHRRSEMLSIENLKEIIKIH